MIKLTEKQKELWKTIPLRGSEFSFVLERLTSDEDTDESRAIRFHEMGVEKDSYNISHAIAAEWGYSFTHLDGCIDGSGREIHAGYSKPPKNRQEALEAMKNFLMRQYVGDAPHPWISMNGHYPFHHYAGEFGFDILNSEVGENINGAQWHMALNRGAAKQYGTPWSIDFSAWNAGTITDYRKGKYWGESSLVHGGHSMNYMKRLFHMVYMAGASEMVAEAGSYISCLDEKDENGILRPSPYGLICKDFYQYVKENPNRGICYTPVAIVLDYYHGAYSGLETRKSFDYFPYNKGDEMTWSLVDMLWPECWSGGWHGVAANNESTMLINSPYGDYYDVFLQNVSKELLQTYPCVILSGDIHFSEDDVNKFTSYVEDGGKLFLNRGYLPSFPAFAGMDGEGDAIECPYGKGSVVIYGYDYDLSGLDIALLSAIRKLIPFRINQKILQMLNVCEDKLLLTLINNSGVTKPRDQEEAVDPGELRYLRVTYTGGEEISSLKNLRTGEVYPAENNTVEFYMQSGEIAILEIKIH